MTMTTELPVEPKPLKLEPPEPLALVVRGHESKVVAYACSKCGSVFSTRGYEKPEDACSAARLHCFQLCACGTLLDGYYVACDLCRAKRANEREREAFASATKVAVEDYDGPVYMEDGPSGGSSECFYADVSEFLDACETDEVDLPEYVWACKPEPLSIDAQEVLNYALGDEDNTVVPEGAPAELQTLLDEWCTRQKLQNYVRDRTRAVVFKPAAQEESTC